MSYELDRQLELGLGGFQTSTNAFSREGGFQAQFRQMGVYLEGSYRILPREYRRLASDDSRNPWSVTAWAPAGFRSSVLRASPGDASADPRTAYPYNTRASSIGGAFEVSRRFSAHSPWSVDSQVMFGTVSAEGQTLSENDIRLRAGYEFPFLGSRTTRVRLGAGGFSRRVLGASSQVVAGFSSMGALLSGELRRTWTSRWSSVITLQVGVPVQVSGTEGGFPSDPSAGPDGANYFWSAGFVSGYGISESLWLLGSFDYEQLRYGLMGTGVSSPSGMAIDQEEGRIRLGLQLRW